MRIHPTFVALAFAAVLPAQAPEAVAAPNAAAPPAQKVSYLEIKGSYQDLPEMAFDPTSLLTGGGARPKAFFKLIEMLDELARSESTEVLLDLSSGVGLNLAQQREVERAMARLSAAGKHVTCYLENTATAAYQVAAQCDHVMLADMAALDLQSPAMQVMHMKDALDLFGVEVEVTKVGAFKGAVEPFMLPSMSHHLRAHYETMLATMNADILRRIAQGRKISEALVRTAQRQRMFSAIEAKTAGLVDRVVPWVGAKRAFELARSGEAPEFVDVGPKKKAPRRDIMSLLSSILRSTKEEEIEDPQIVVMHLSGQIVDGDKAVPGSMVSGAAAKKLDELAENELVKGVVVRINSPGGSATASEEIRLALQRLAAHKPVVFSMGEMAASGGYWITTIGRPILAEIGTLTGSIGVFGMRFQPGALMRRVGLNFEVVALDDGALMDAMDRPWSDAARARMQSFVDGIYDRFLANVASSRDKTTAEVDAIAGGRVWSGQQAVENGLVDAIGGLDEAIAAVKSEAGLEADVEVIHMPQPKSFADTLFESMFEARVAGCVDGDLVRRALTDWLQLTEVVGVLREALASDGGMQTYALMPIGLRVR